MCTLGPPLHTRTQQLRVGAEALVAAMPAAAHIVPFEARADWSLPTQSRIYRVGAENRFAALEFRPLGGGRCRRVTNCSARARLFGII